MYRERFQRFFGIFRKQMQKIDFISYVPIAEITQPISCNTQNEKCN